MPRIPTIHHSPYSFHERLSNPREGEGRRDIADAVLCCRYRVNSAASKTSASFAFAASNEYLWHLLQSSCQGEIRFMVTSLIWRRVRTGEIAGCQWAICIWYFRSLADDYRGTSLEKETFERARTPPFCSSLDSPIAPTSFHESPKRWREMKRQKREGWQVGGIYRGVCIEVFRWLVTRLWWKCRQRKSLW